MTQSDPTKRIPNLLTNNAELVGSYTVLDLAVVTLPGVAVLFGGQYLVPASVPVAGLDGDVLLLVLAIGSMGLGALFVYLTPQYVTSIEWLAMMTRFHTSTNRLAHEAGQEHTQIKRIHPEYDALERTDGTLIGFVQVDPPKMALATDEEWQQKALSFRDFLNTTVEFPVQLFATTQPVPIDSYLSHYEARLDDPDVEANPQLASLIERYVEWYASELDHRRTTIREHYVIVQVTPREVRYERAGIAAQLAALPVVGLVIDALFAPPIAVQRASMCETLQERVRRVEHGLREIDGCEAHQLDASAAVAVVAEYWSDQPFAYDDVDAVLEPTTVVGAGRDP